MQITPEDMSTEVVVKYIAILMSVLTNVAFVAKYLIDRTDTKADKNVALIDKWIERLSAELVAADLNDKEKDEKIESLQECIDDRDQRIKQARLDLIGLRNAVKEVKKFCDRRKIDDEEILQTVRELEETLSGVTTCLKEAPKTK